MPHSSLYELLRRMDIDNIILAYRGEINGDLLESVYEMMSKQTGQAISPDKNKKLLNILIESLQNAFHHQATISNDLKGSENMTGFIITSDTNNTYRIVTGNYILNNDINTLKQKLEKVNSLSPEELRSHYQNALAGNEFSEKGGAGLGIIEMARKSGNKLSFEFTKVNDTCSFFSLEITI